jgi:hypothetical protein
MELRRIEPTGAAAKAVECYWTVKNAAAKPVKQKVIPDGFTEIIFHFGDQYRINLDGRWRKQGMQLLAGQITKFFYLENSGVTDIFGIKLKPAALTHLFGISMKDKVDKVVKWDIRIDMKNADEYFNKLCSKYPENPSRRSCCRNYFQKEGNGDHGVGL